MNTNKSFIGLLLFFSLISTQYTHAQNSLIVKFNDGSETRTLLSTLDRITFSDGNMVLKKTDATSSDFIISNVGKMTFGSYDAVQDVFNDKESLAIYPSPATNYIRLKNAPADHADIIIFGLDGTVLIKERLTDSTQQIDISNLASGLYLITVNNKTMKFTKQ
jgi:hypothetical protein